MEWQKPLPQLKVDISPIPVPPPLVPPPVPQPLPPDPRIPVIPNILQCVGDFYDVDIGNAGGTITQGSLPAGLNIVGERLQGILTTAGCNDFTISRAGYTQEVKAVVVDGNIFTPTILSQNNNYASFSGLTGTYIEVCDIVKMSLRYTRTLNRVVQVAEGSHGANAYPYSMFHAYNPSDQKFYIAFVDGTIRRYSIGNNQFVEDTAWGYITLDANQTNDVIYSMDIINNIIYFAIRNGNALKFEAYSLATKARDTSSDITLGGSLIATVSGITYIADNVIAVGIDTNRIYLNQGVATFGAYSRSRSEVGQPAKTGAYTLSRIYGHDGAEDASKRQHHSETITGQNRGWHQIKTDNANKAYFIDVDATGHIGSADITNGNIDYNTYDIGISHFNVQDADLIPNAPNGDFMVFLDKEFDIEAYKVFPNEKTEFFAGLLSTLNFEIAPPVGTEIDNVRLNSSRPISGITVAGSSGNTRILISEDVNLESVELSNLDITYRIVRR